MIIITGASKGIGKFLFESYLKGNNSVAGTYLNSKPPTNTQNYYQLDVTNLNMVEAFIKELENKLESITLINCAGISYNSFTHKSDAEKWRKVIETNLFGSYNMVKTLLPIMRTQKFGRIINFSSVVAVKPTPGVSSYASSKSALWGFSKSVAIENAALNVTINCIDLGYTELGMIEEVPEEFKKNIISQIPAGKLCEPKDILNTVEFLRTTGYITGSSINLSGGLV
jgi:NAD(P)-dependent dehydrogenase (short-subunit alcohol dehydrogenase family)